MDLNLIFTGVKALVKRKLHVGGLNGLERFILAQIAIPDRVVTTLGATNFEPGLIDEKYNYKMLTESVEANLELFSRIKERFPFDLIMAPCWMGMMFTGAAELGVRFKIEESRVAYAAEHPIKDMKGVHNITPLSEPSGYFKMTLDIYREAQRRFSDTLILYSNDGPWDLAMLLRGDQHLPRDFRLYKDYVETKDPARKEKIRKYGDPDLWPAIMELTTKIVIQNFRLARQYGVNMTGAMMVDQFATEPVLGIDDFTRYVLPYVQRAWVALDKKVGMAYMVTSPQKFVNLFNHPVLSKSLAMSGSTNYIFPTTPEGLTLPEYDRPMLEMANRDKRCYMYVLNAKFIRDATPQELEDTLKRICQMATGMKASMIVLVPAVAPGTDLRKIDLTLDSINKYGRY
jgi:Uroporphyrinogen decarboxylase (URO-D)